MIHTRETQQLVTFLGRARVDFQLFFEKVVRFHMFYWHRILKLLKLHCVWKDFDMRARRPRACALCVIFCKGWWPWHVRIRDWGSSKHVKKLLAKARLTEMFKKCWVSYESARARGMKFWQFFFLKNHWVFDVFMLQSLRTLRFWKDFVLRARMSTLPYFLQSVSYTHLTLPTMMSV